MDQGQHVKTSWIDQDHIFIFLLPLQYSQNTQLLSLWTQRDWNGLIEEVQYMKWVSLLKHDCQKKTKERVDLLDRKLGLNIYTWAPFWVLILTDCTVCRHEWNDEVEFKIWGVKNDSQTSCWVQYMTLPVKIGCQYRMWWVGFWFPCKLDSWIRVLKLTEARETDRLTWKWHRSIDGWLDEITVNGPCIWLTNKMTKKFEHPRLNLPDRSWSQEWLISAVDRSWDMTKPTFFLQPWSIETYLASLDHHHLRIRNSEEKSYIFHLFSVRALTLDGYIYIDQSLVVRLGWCLQVFELHLLSDSAFSDSDHRSSAVTSVT